MEGAWGAEARGPGEVLGERGRGAEIFLPTSWASGGAL